jgi:dATP pyrophosphohydrolase
MNIKTNLVEVHIYRIREGKMEFLLLKRSEKVIFPGLWQMVNGHSNEGETAYETALREIKEETGNTPEFFWAAPNVNRFYSAEDDSIYILPVFAARLSSADSVTICDEHCDYMWASPETAKEMVTWPGQRNSIDIIVEYVLNKPDLVSLLVIKHKT